MFNWYSLPSLVAMLLFWMLAAYVLTRSPRSLTALTAVAAQVSAALFCLAQTMEANAPSVGVWLDWSRALEWSAALAPALWYWLTVLLVREREVPANRRYLRLVGYPLGVLVGAGALGWTAATYAGDSLYVWSAAGPLPPELAVFFRYNAPTTETYSVVVALVALATLGAGVNCWLGWRHSPDPEGRQRFAWLALSAGLFVLGAISLAAITWLRLPTYWLVWSYLAIGAAETAMALNVAASSLFVHGRVIQADFLYFVCGLTVVCLLYVAVLALAGAAYSFELLRLLVAAATLAVLSHALLDQGRRLLDRMFFAAEVGQLRADLAGLAQSAAVSPDLGPLLDRAQADLAEVSARHLARLVEEALRALNRPAVLAQCRLAVRLPRTLAAHRGEDPAAGPPAPLEQARILRAVLVEEIERLRPAGSAAKPGDPVALQHLILRDEYVLEKPNKQIMIRHSLSEGTFNRNRREAILGLARELGEWETRLARELAASRATFAAADRAKRPRLAGALGRVRGLAWRLVPRRSRSVTGDSRQA